jgi:hypothetical protein
MKSMIKILLPLGLYFTILILNHPSLDKNQAEVTSEKAIPYLIAQTNN